MTTRKRRSHQELFLDRLREMSHGEVKPVGNATLRQSLNWDEKRYERIKSKLVGEGLVKPGRGQGGSVCLTKSAKTAPPKIFVSYCHTDRALKAELQKHLEPLKRLKIIQTWTDRELKPGDEWDREISNNLEEAEIILLLISIDFINSKYCYDIELKRAIARHEEGSAVVIPVILRTCLWQHAPFAKLQVLPQSAKSVVSWSSQDEALTSVAEGVLKIAKELRKSSKS